MILYHSTNIDFDAIDLGMSKPNRDFNQEFNHDYDVVYGPIANDNVGEQIRKFRSLRIPLDQFLEELKYAKGVTYQYAFCTQKSIETLKEIR